MNAIALQERITAFGFHRLSPADQATWLAGMKGFFNVSDFNRIRQNTIDIAALIGVTLPETVAAWTTATLPTYEEMEKLRANISALRASRPLPSATPAVPWSLDYPTINKINAIERILYEVWRTTQ